MSYYVGEGLFNRFYKKVCLRYIFLSEHRSRILKFSERESQLFIHILQYCCFQQLININQQQISYLFGCMKQNTITKLV